MTLLSARRTMSQLWTTWQRLRHLGVALMTCAVVLGAYLLWTSTSNRVARHGVYDFFYELHNLDIQASNHKISLLGSLANHTSKRMPVYDDNVKPISVTLSGRTQRVRPVTQKHDEHKEVISREEHIGQISSADSNFSRHKNSRRRNRWRLQDLHDVEPGLLPDKNSNGRESQLLRSAASPNISRSIAENSVTPKPIYLVVPVEEKVTESVEDFREPEVIIRAADADMPQNSRVSSNAGGVASEFGSGGGKRSPLLGALHGGPGNCRVYSTRNDIPELVDFAAGVDCFDLATTPTVVVCPYPNADDRHLSQPLRTHGVWESHIVRLFQAALSSDNEFGVYDIGANVGQYSLLAAAMGRRVVAVELYRPNIYRLHKAVKLGRLEDKIVVVENGVSDKRETFELEVKDGDPSGVRLTTHDADKFCDEPGCPPHATTILLDDLLEVTNFKAAVMKIDVEGYEHRAFFHADQLLSDVRVAYIFIEWVKMRAFYGAEVDDSPDKRLVQHMIDTLASRQYLPYGVTNAPLRILDLRTWYLWPDDIVWVLAGSVEPKRLSELAPEVPSSRQLSDNHRAVLDA